MFKKAQPIWPEGLRKEMNRQILFSSDFLLEELPKDGEALLLRIAGATFFRVFLNRRFVHHGPARAPHGYIRMDEVSLEGFLRRGVNTLTVESAGYNCPCFYGVAMPSFLQFEVEWQGRILVHTGPGGRKDAAEVHGRLMREREQRCLRYSYQRHFSEVYGFNSGGIKDPTFFLVSPEEEVLLTSAPHHAHFLARKLPIPDYSKKRPAKMKGPRSAGKMGAAGGNKNKRKTDLAQVRYILDAGNGLPGFPPTALRTQPLEILQDRLFTVEGLKGAELPVTVGTGEYLVLDMGRNFTGFIGSSMEVLEKSRVYLFFDEKLINGALWPETWETVNAVSYDLGQSQDFAHLSYEPYSFRFLICYVETGEIRLEDIYLREYAYPLERHPLGAAPEPATEDEELLRIYKAAKESFRQSTLDVFMDCPGRERAGWLCDSYFTAPAALHFTGNSLVEREMMEDFLRFGRMPKHEPVPGLPEGMIPMCYPADSPGGEFIPQWGMWFVLQLREYFGRNPQADPEEYRSLCLGLTNFYKKHENEDGLLENMPGWNFVDWSRANDWTEGVNYPTNMLYAEMLDFIGMRFGPVSFRLKASRLREKILEKSWDGEFFRDHARRNQKGDLITGGERSEACQYYSLAFGIAEEKWKGYAGFRERVLDGFGPEAAEAAEDPVPAELLVGKMLRLELLFRWGKYRRLIEEIRLLFGKQAKLTGTLWEHRGLRGSLNHGFGSYAGYLLYHSLKEID